MVKTFNYAMNPYYAQYGHGIPAFRGAAIQKGHGFGGIFGGLARSFAPVLKKGLFHAGKKALKVVPRIIGDVKRGTPFTESLTNRSMDGLYELGSDLHRAIVPPMSNVKQKRRSISKKNIRKRASTASRGAILKKRKRAKDIFD